MSAYPPMHPIQQDLYEAYIRDVQESMNLSAENMLLSSPRQQGKTRAFSGGNWRRYRRKILDVLISDLSDYCYVKGAVHALIAADWCELLAHNEAAVEQDWLPFDKLLENEDALARAIVRCPQLQNYKQIPLEGISGGLLREIAQALQDHERTQRLHDALLVAEL